MAWKGLILAGGFGTRLAPLTGVTNKHLLPVFDKPMIYYALSTLMLAKVREMAVVTSPEAESQFRSLLGDGSQWGLKFVYRIQDKPSGIAEGIRLAADWLAGSSVALILGDNIFYGPGFGTMVEARMSENNGATIFVQKVHNPRAFGVVVLDSAGKPIAIEEKPQHPRSSTAVTGLYLFDPDVIDIATNLKASYRGELEITDVNRDYLNRGKLKVHELGRGIAWLDGGTPQDLFEASQFIKVIQDRTGIRIACPEEIAFRRGFIDRAQFAALIDSLPKSTYSDYFTSILEDTR
jgi:glucose-1-phosphate thymidylyltransferase